MIESSSDPGKTDGICHQAASWVAPDSWASKFIECFPDCDLTAANSYIFFEYSALVVSLAELGVGARESAVRLLEREIESQREALDKFKPQAILQPSTCANSASAKCQNENQLKIQYLRRLIVLLRLELIQSDLLNAASGPVSSTALNPTRIRRWMEMVKDYDDALFFFDGDERRRNSLRKASFDGERAKCAPDVATRGVDVSQSFGDFMLAQLAVKNYLVDFAAKDRTIIRDQPAYMRNFDDLANDLATFDLDCLGQLRANFDTARSEDIQARIFESVASYWVAKGENFGADSDEERSDITPEAKTRIKALCDAKRLYTQAKPLTEKAYDAATKASGQSLSVSSYDDLERNLTLDEAANIRSTVKEGLARTKRALRDFPIGDVDNVDRTCL